jgi:hypothetical protein
VGLAFMFTAQLVLWVPTYLVRPWWGDHDVFATMAQGWDRGLLPYRDLIGNNFPGTIYLCWVLGKLFGWGNSAAFYAVDAALIISLVVVLVAWSLRRFGRALPGLLGAGAYLAFFLPLDFSQAAQRDGQAPVLAVIGLLLIEAWPGRLTRYASAFLLALGLTIRPQVAAFIPAYWLAIDETVRPSGEASRSSFVAILVWTCVLAIFVPIGMVPLAVAGVFGDFVQSIKGVAYGSNYNKVSGFAEVAKRLALQFYQHRLLLIPPVAVFLGSRSLRAEDRRLALTWGLAFLGVAFYYPLSPGDHLYLHQPFWIVAAVFVAILTQLVLTAPGLTSTWRLSFVALLIGLVVTFRPDSMGRTPTLAAIRALRSGQPVATTPLGYEHPFPWIPRYPWEDYVGLIAHLRSKTNAETRVANLVPGFAITGPAARLPAFPAESANWITIVHPEDEPRFVEALVKTPDSVVVWDPAYTRELANPKDKPKKLSLLLETIPQLYEPSAKFGLLEVWTRKPGPSKAGPGM